MRSTSISVTRSGEDARRSNALPVARIIVLVLQYIVAFILPTSFLLFLVISDKPVILSSAAPWIAQNPHYTVVVVTIISAALAWLAKQLFSTLVEWVAEVRSYNGIKMESVELLAALRSGTALGKRGQRVNVLVTWASVAMLALLSAGYTTLLLPLPVTLVNTAMGWEINFLSQDPGCADWFSDLLSDLDDASCTWKVRPIPTFNLNTLAPNLIKC